MRGWGQQCLVRAGPLLLPWARLMCVALWCWSILLRIPCMYCTFILFCNFIHVPRHLSTHLFMHHYIQSCTHIQIHACNTHALIYPWLQHEHKHILREQQDVQPQHPSCRNGIKAPRKDPGAGVTVGSFVEGCRVEQG